MGSCPACVERVIGTREGDRIVGDDRPQAILGGDGDDELDGRGGRTSSPVRAATTRSRRATA
jgi:hypothetical protein